MTRFIAGIAAAVIVHLLGWPRIETALRVAGDGAASAYATVETQVRASKVGK
jgi:hypothetical protein